MKLLRQSTAGRLQIGRRRPGAGFSSNTCCGIIGEGNGAPSNQADRRQLT